MAVMGGAGMDPVAGHETVRPTGEARPRWAMMAIEVSHCGSGCALGDLRSGTWSPSG
jgi:hypothetical protein